MNPSNSAEPANRARTVLGSSIGSWCDSACLPSTTRNCPNIVITVADSEYPRVCIPFVCLVYELVHGCQHTSLKWPCECECECAWEGEFTCPPKECARIASVRVDRRQPTDHGVVGRVCSMVGAELQGKCNGIVFSSSSSSSHARTPVHERFCSSCCGCIEESRSG